MLGGDNPSIQIVSAVIKFLKVINHIIEEDISSGVADFL